MVPEKPVRPFGMGEADGPAMARCALHNIPNYGESDNMRLPNDLVHGQVATQKHLTI